MLKLFRVDLYISKWHFFLQKKSLPLFHLHICYCIFTLSSCQIRLSCSVVCKMYCAINITYLYIYHLSLIYQHHLLLFNNARKKSIFSISGHNQPLYITPLCSIEIKGKTVSCLTLHIFLISNLNITIFTHPCIYPTYLFT